MRYGLFGKSGLRVSELCLGAMTFGEAWQDMRIAAPREECCRIFETFAAAGGNFIDTANHYNFGASEEFLGEFVRPDRERFVLATKYSREPTRSQSCAAGRRSSVCRCNTAWSSARLNATFSQWPTTSA